MANFNKVILLGNLTRDPELCFTPSGTPVVSFGLAVNTPRTGSSSTGGGGVACILQRYALTPLGSRPPRPWGSVSIFSATGWPSHSAKSVWSSTASSVSG